MELIKVTTARYLQLVISKLGYQGLVDAVLIVLLVKQPEAFFHIGFWPSPTEFLCPLLKPVRKAFLGFRAYPASQVMVHKLIKCLIFSAGPIPSLSETITMIVSSKFLQTAAILELQCRVQHVFSLPFSILHASCFDHHNSRA